MVASNSNSVSLSLASVQQDFSQSSDHSNIDSSINEQLVYLTNSVGGKDGQFDIRNHLDKLTPAKGKNRYECPICGGDNLTLDPPTGKYQCWNYERDKKHLAEIREFLSPWADKSNGKTYALPQRQSKPKLSPPKPAKIPDAPIKLARFPQPVQVITNTNGISKTEYRYGNDRVMIRIDKPDGDKICFPMTGKVKGKKEQWEPYRSEEVLELGKGQWVLGAEGEKCVETARALGIVAWTMQASDWRENLDNPSHFALLMAMLRFKQAEVAGIVYFPDNDAIGFKKAQTVSIACAMSGMPCIILDPLQIDPDATDGWDIADWVSRVSNSILFADEIVSAIEFSAEEIKSREAVSGDRTQSDNIKTDEDDKNWTPSQSGFNPDNGNFGVPKREPCKTLRHYQQVKARLGNSLKFNEMTQQVERDSVPINLDRIHVILNDPTGDRRFWVVPVKKSKHDQIDIGLLKKERNALWAAAMKLYLAGEIFYLTDEEKILANESNKDFQVEDTWESYIIPFLAGKNFVTVGEVLQNCIQLEIGKQDRTAQSRVYGILRRNGWEQTKKRVEGKELRGWGLKPTVSPTSQVVSHPQNLVQQELKKIDEKDCLTSVSSVSHPQNLVQQELKLSETDETLKSSKLLNSDSNDNPNSNAVDGDSEKTKSLTNSSVSTVSVSQTVQKPHPISTLAETLPETLPQKSETVSVSDADQVVSKLVKLWPSDDRVAIGQVLALCNQRIKLEVYDRHSDAHRAYFDKCLKAYDQSRKVK